MKTDPLQRPSSHQSDEIEAEDSEEQGEYGYQPIEIKIEDREKPDRP